MFYYELIHHLRRPIVYVFSAVLFALTFLTMWGMASEAAGEDGAEVLNSAHRLHLMSRYFGTLVLLMLPATFGAVLYRDYRSRMYTLLYSYPITKRSYLGGKFLTASLLTGILLIAMLGGFAAGALMPGLPAEVVKPFAVSDYVRLYGIFLMPNALLFGAVVFTVVSRTRSVYSGYLAVISLVLLRGISQGLGVGEAAGAWATVLDPTGNAAFEHVSRLWTQLERNVAPLPGGGFIALNRLLWLGVTCVILTYTYRAFDFRIVADDRSRKGIEQQAPAAARLEFPVLERPAGQLTFTRLSRLRTLAGTALADFRYLVFSRSFAGLLLLGFAAVYFQQFELNPAYGVERLPTTARMLRVPMFIFGMVISLMTFLYVGILLLRDRTTRMAPLIDTVPQPNGLFLGARLSAVILTQILLLGLVLLAGVTAQAWQGYYRFEIGHYLLELFGLRLSHFAVWTGVGALVYTLVRNLYLGLVVLLLIPTLTAGLGEVANFLDWDFLRAGVFHFNQVPGLGIGFPYSDLNGYGSILPAYAAYKVYWGLLSVTCALTALLFWQRGEYLGWRHRLSAAKRRTKGALRAWLLVVGTSFLVLGGYLYAVERWWAPTAFDENRRALSAARNEQLYGAFRNLPQPRLARAEVNVDIFPERRDFVATGTLNFVNRLAYSLDTVLVATSFRELTEYSLETPSQAVSRDSLLHFDVWKLAAPLDHGDTLRLDFTVKNHPNTRLLNNSAVLSNGTYLTSEILPRLGFREIPLRDVAQRTARGLPPLAAVEPPGDTTLLGYANSSNNAGRITYTTTISTALDQSAWSMGRLTRSWTEGGRRYARFRSDGPIVNNMSWLSGRWEARVAPLGDVTLIVYRHPAHDHNYEHIVAGVRAAVEYCGRWFGPLAHDTLRLIEFPHTEGTHATLNGNLIPYSESLFLAQADSTRAESFQLPFYSAAHEVAHYWWGHRVDPAEVRGNKLVTEALAEYLAMRMYEDRFGSARARTFRRDMYDLYLRERIRRGDERPLVLAGADDEYLNYRKGGAAFYTLSEYWGERNLNAALAAFEREHRFAPPPYPTAGELIEHLRTSAPDNLHYLLKDYFEKITFYDHELLSTQTTDHDTSYTTRLTYRLTKYRTDAQGRRTFLDRRGEGLQEEGEASLPLADYVRIGFYRKTPRGEHLIRLVTTKATAIHNELTVRLRERPDRVVIDPEGLLFVEE